MSEGRTMQFVVERECPNGGSANIAEKVVALFPLPIWVRWPPEPVTDHSCSKTTRVFRVTEDSIRETARRAGLPAPPNPNRRCVCDCMGSLIE